MEIIRDLKQHTSRNSQASIALEMVGRGFWWWVLMEKDLLKRLV